MRTARYTMQLLPIVMLVINALALALPFPAEGSQWTQAEKAAQTAAGAALQARLTKAVSMRDTLFRIAPGVYRFEPNGLQVGYATNMIIIADDVMIIQKPGSDGVRFTACEKVSFTGCTFDSDPLPFTQGEIRYLSGSNDSIVIELEEGYPDPITASHLKDGLKALIFDRTGEMRSDFREWAVGSPKRLPSGFIEVPFPPSPSVGNFFKELNAIGSKVGSGDRLVLKKRIHSGVILKQCASMSLERITSYMSSGFSFFELFGDGGNSYRNCRVLPRPGTTRLLAGNYDGIHSFCMRRGPSIEGCEINNIGDDGITIHGFIAVVTDGPKDDAYELVSMQMQTFGEGTPVRCYRGKDLCFLGDAVVGSMKSTDAMQARHEEIRKRLRLTDGLQRSKPFRVSLRPSVALEIGDIVEAPGLCGNGFSIVNTRIANSRSRGIIVRASSGVIASNRIDHVYHSGIMVGENMQEWMEGNFPHRVRIVGNYLSNCNFSATERVGVPSGSIHIGYRLFPGNTLDSLLANTTMNISDIIIHGNTVVDPGSHGISLWNATDLSIVSNAVIRAGLFPAYNIYGLMPEIMRFYAFHEQNIGNAAVSHNDVAELASNADAFSPRFKADADRSKRMEH